MFGRKLKWYILFENEEDFENLFVGKTAVVHRGPFGEVLFVKNKSEYHAFKNKCPHQNKPLNGCSTEDNRIVCPFHRHSYSIENGQGHGTYVHKYEFKIEGGKVKVGKEVWSLF